MTVSDLEVILHERNGKVTSVEFHDSPLVSGEHVVTTLKGELIPPVPADPGHFTLRVTDYYSVLIPVNEVIRVWWE